MKSNLRKGLGSLTAVPLFIAIVIAVNLIGLFFFARIDATDERIYSLSDASKHLARSMDDPVVCKLYFSEDIPAPYNAYARYLKDQLYEYRAYSHGLLRFEFIDPAKTDREKEAQALGIPALQVQAIEKDKMELKKVYMGLAFLYEDKKEVIPVVQSTRNLEYEISSAIRKVTSKEVPVIGVLSGHGEQGQGNGLDNVWQSLEKLYQPRAVRIAPGQFIDPKVATLLIVGPADSLSKWDQYAIDQFIMRGGKLAVFYDPVQTDFQNSQATDRHSNWGDFLSKYGVAVAPALIIDAHCARIGVAQQQGNIRFQNVVEYPFMPDVRLFNPNHLVGKDLEGVDFPFVSPVDSTRAQGSGLTFTSICWTSEHSGVLRAPYNVNPMRQFTQADFDQPRQIVAGALSGHFTSAFPDGPPPDTAVSTATLPPTIKEVADNRIVVVGDADCATDQATRNPANAAFVLNIVDWLSQEEGLITIRSRDVSSRPLEEVSDGTRQATKYANVFGPPILVVIFGLWRWQSRRRHKQGGRDNA
jgi:gliding-associated putative ABC transporter substrate-binding component GldG